MSESASGPSLEKQQRRAAEFLQILPLTIELAGLPQANHGQYYSEDQIQARAMTMKNAYKVARQMLMEVVNH